MATTERVTVTRPIDLVERMDRLERNRSRFMTEAAERELARRRRGGLLRSIETPIPSLPTVPTSASRTGPRPCSERRPAISPDRGRARDRDARRGIALPGAAAAASGLVKTSYALIDHLRPIDKGRIHRVFGRISDDELVAVDRGLRLFLGLPLR